MLPVQETDPMIASSAELAENDVLPRLYEVHFDATPADDQPVDLPPSMKAPASSKSAACWAYERLLLYISNFEAQLQPDAEVAMAFAGSDAGVIRIEGMGYFDPDIITFYGTDDAGQRTQIIQHVGQLNVMLRAMRRDLAEGESPRRIGFQLTRALDQPAPRPPAAGADPAPGGDSAGLIR
jgi:hypothetical protein